MEQHPIPRQITSFEFKLIGFLTIKQFIYLIIFFPLGFVVFKIFPIPIVNILIAASIAIIGPILAFLPINDRPMEVFIRNLIKRLTSPTQYTYKKENKPIYFLRNLIFLSNPHITLSHIESQEKLANYLNKKTALKNNNKQNISNLFSKPSSTLIGDKTETQISQPQATLNANPSITQQNTPIILDTGVKKTFFTGLIKNYRLIPLPGILIYVKDSQNKVIRLLKTNQHGVFATFNPLSPGEYIFETRDPKNTYFFDTMKIKVDEFNPRPIEIYSKEML